MAKRRNTANYKQRSIDGQTPRQKPAPRPTKSRPYPMQKWQQVADLQTKNAQLEKKLAAVNRERDGLQVVVHSIMALNVFAGMAMQRAA